MMGLRTPPQKVFLFCSICWALGLVLHIFTRLSILLAWGRIPAYRPQASVKKPWSNSGEEIPFPQGNLRAEALLQLLDTVLGYQIALQKNGREQPSFALYSKSKRKGEGSPSLLSPSSLTVFISQLQFANLWLHHVPLQGWQNFVCWRKQTALPCPCSYSKTEAYNDNAEYGFNSVYPSAHHRCQPQELWK